MLAFSGRPFGVVGFELGTDDAHGGLPVQDDHLRFCSGVCA